jgi:transposase
VIIAEVGVDMTRFPTPAHLSPWARFAPGVRESAGRKKGTGSTRHGDRYLARVLGEAAVGASKTNTFLVGEPTVIRSAVGWTLSGSTS